MSVLPLDLFEWLLPLAMNCLREGKLEKVYFRLFKLFGNSSLEDKFSKYQKCNNLTIFWLWRQSILK